MATKPVVQIDGKNFVAVPQGRSERVVRRLRNEDFISQFSGEGIRSPSTFLGYQTLIFPNFSLGLGRERIDSDSARVSGEYRRFWDATCDTRFASGVYLPILEEDSTSTGLEVIRASTYSVLNRIFDMAPPFLIGMAIDIVVRKDASVIASWGVPDRTHQFVLLTILTAVIWALESLFQFDVRLDESAPTTGLGSLARVRFDHGREPVGWRALRSARRLFLRRLRV